MPRLDNPFRPPNKQKIEHGATLDAVTLFKMGQIDMEQLEKSLSHKKIAKYRDAAILKKVDPTQYVATVRKDLKSKAELKMEARRRSERQKKFVESPLAEFPLQDLDSDQEGVGGDI